MLKLEVGGRQRIAEEDPSTRLTEIMLSKSPGCLEHWKVECFSVAEGGESCPKRNPLALAANPRLRLWKAVSLWRPPTLGQNATDMLVVTRAEKTITDSMGLLRGEPKRLMTIVAVHPVH